ncbi:MAG TPA: gliding motility-associated C-terminal domain-containing protein [Ohtaekwangia sp.]
MSPIRCCCAIISIAILSYSNLYAQDVLWAKQTTNVAFLEGVLPVKMETDNAGNAYVLYVLMNRSILDGVLMTSDGWMDILLVKYDNDGNILWKNQMGGADWDQASDMVIDNTGNVLLTGIMPNGGSFMGQTLDINNGGAFVAKIDPDGTLIWVRQYGDINGQGQVICADKNNNVIVTGKNNLDHLVVIKYDAAGTVLWSKPIQYLTCCIPPRADDVAVDSQNNIILSGSFVGHISFSGVTLQAPIYYSGYILKMTADGNYLWSNQVDGGNTSDSYAMNRDLAIDSDDNIFITGHFRTSATFDNILLTENNPVNDRTGFIARLTPSGVFSWAKPIFGRDLMTTGVKINPNTNELNIIGGGLIGYQYDDQYISPEQINQDFVIITDLSGEFKRAIDVKASISDVSYDTDNNLFVTGNAYQDVTLGCFSLTGNYYTGYLFKTGKLPDIKITGITQACMNQEVVFTAEGDVSGATKFVWTFPPDFVSSTGSFETTENSIVVTTGNTTEAFVSVLPYYACYPLTAYGKMFMLRDVPAKPDIPTGDTIVCPESSHLYHVLKVPTATSYSWQLSGLLVPDANQPVVDSAFRVRPLNAFTTGSIRVFASNSCGQSEPSEPLNISRYEIPSIPVISADDEICANEAVIFKATSSDALSFGWRFSIQPGFTAVNNDSSEIDIHIPAGDSQITAFAVARGVCDTISSAPFDLTVLQPLSSDDIVGMPFVCKGDDVHYEISSVPNGTQVTWTAPPGFFIIGAADNEVDYSVTDQAVSGALKVEVSNGCFEDISTLQVDVNSVPEIPVIVSDKCERTLSYEGQDIFTWYQNNSALSNLEHVLTVSDSGFYKIQTQNQCGVSESEEIKLNPVVYGDLFVPNVITPDDNGLNDYFIVDPGIKTPSLKIINRWGELVYKNEQYHNDWDGRSLPSGVYYYIISNECLSSPIKGWLQIISAD